MKLTRILISTVFVLTLSSVFAADEVKNIRIGAADVTFNFETNDVGVTILTLVAQMPETNNSLRGLKNVDQRRLSKLGYLAYQCKIMLYQSDKSDSGINPEDPFLISRNYSLFTGVDLPLSADERVGIQVQALQPVNDNSLFSVTLGNGGKLTTKWETKGDGTAINLRQFDVNVLNESDLIETSESIEIVTRFPIFQMEKPVSQWRYSFLLKDFKQAVQHINENCTPDRFKAMIESKSIG